MGKGKPRHNNENQMKKPCNRKGYCKGTDGHIYCTCYDGLYLHSDGTIGYILERSYPWCWPSDCKCNPYKCESTRAKWYASLSDEKHERIESGKATVNSIEITREYTSRHRKKH